MWPFGKRCTAPIHYHFECIFCGHSCDACLDTGEELQEWTDALKEEHLECKPIGMCNAAELKYALRFKGDDG